MTDVTLNDYRAKFRPDIQALRALAVVLVVAYHAHLPGAHGGFLGVDVFFVISGFVITGVLLQERATTQRTSIADFYARRIRRILPAGTLVLIATIFATYHWLGFITGGNVADDAKWVSGFIGNFHFASTGTNYLTATQPPSTLQQYWSLAVEEQFYLVWPLLFLVLTTFARRIHARTKLISALVVIMIASIAWSIIQTNQSPTLAFFSPWVRAWELALGALIAIAAPWLRGKSPQLGVAFGAIGVAVIAACTWFVTSNTVWPGSAVLIPVFATGLVIAGGTMRERDGLGNDENDFGPITNFFAFQWLGKISYSLYLVHWPILIIAAQYSLSGKVSTTSNLELIALSIVVAAASYYLVENPLRAASWLKANRFVTYAFGAALVAASYGALFWHLHNYGM